MYITEFAYMTINNKTHKKKKQQIYTFLRNFTLKKMKPSWHIIFKMDNFQRHFLSLINHLGDGFLIIIEEINIKIISWYFLNFQNVAYLGKLFKHWKKAFQVKSLILENFHLYKKIPLEHCINSF